jgi:hypothetical protein
VAQRIEGRDPGAEQRRGIGGGKLVGNCGKRTGGSHHRLGVAAVIRDAGYAQVPAVDQPAAPARLATLAIPAKPADADALSGAPIDDAGNLVPGDARVGEAGPLSFDGETVAVADTTGLDANANLAPRRLGHVALDELKRTARLRDLNRSHFCHRRLLVGRAMPGPVPVSRQKCGSFDAVCGPRGPDWVSGKG